MKCQRMMAALLVLSSVLGTGEVLSQSPGQKYPGLPSETPEKFEPTNDVFDYVKRDVIIPMRDGVNLHTVIIVPKGAKGAPIFPAHGLQGQVPSGHCDAELSDQGLVGG